MKEREYKIVKVEGVEGFHMGYFNDVMEEWFIIGFSGDWQVSEWWELPIEGTGRTSHPST